MKKKLKSVVPLKYLSNFFRSLEVPLINCKVKLNLTWKKECVLSTDAANTAFIINDTKLYVVVVTLSKEDNEDFIEQQNKGVKRSIYWNEYKTKEKDEKADDNNANTVRYINLDPSFQGVNRLFLMEYDRTAGQATRNGQRKYYLPRVDLKKYNAIIDPGTIQQIEFKYMLETISTIYWVLEKSKETILEFYKGTVKIY